MGWFWSDAPATVPAHASQGPSPSQLPASHPTLGHGDASPPAGCPMHKRTMEAMNTSPFPNDTGAAPSGCPVNHAVQPESQTSPKPQSTLSKLNPLNYMFPDLSQAPAANQTVSLPTSRDESSIPKGTGEGNWEYPSPQQMYNALLRKGYTDTDATAIESMVAVHNFLNEGAWAEIVEWERRFGKGLARGWEISRRGEANAPMEMRRIEAREGHDDAEPPTLLRFQGRPKEMTPRAALLQMMGRVYPSQYGNDPPFDRHDWYVSRKVNGQEKQVRYVIDFYAGPPEPTGEPVFYLDVRPAVTPTAAVERMMRWGGDVWWRASGGDVREASTKK